MKLKNEFIVETNQGVPYIKLCNVEHFSVNKIFDCGQCFRFDRVENSLHEIEFSGIAFNKYISFAQDGKDIYIYNTTAQEFEDIWEHYLALDVDYKLINDDILSRSDNINLRNAIEFGDGIRILNQDRWETICSFIISQNNNIPRIKKIIEALSEKCGEKVDIPEGLEKHLSSRSSLHSFPTPQAIIDLGVDGLYDLKTGFRAKYIYDAAEKFLCGDLDCSQISNASTKDAINMLCKVKGIGPKVASCALLFAFEKYDAFPIDVWIKKVIQKYFSSEDEKSFDPSALGKYAGIAQQYLFYYERYGGYMTK